MTNSGGKFLFEYLNNYSPTGQEIEGQKVWMNEMDNYADEVFIDTYGNAIAVFNKDAEFKILLEAHVDEIGWNVNYIDSNGYIYVQRNGGSDNITAPGKEVVIIADNGEYIHGVFGQTAIHMRDRSKGENAIKVEDLYIDIGATSKEDVNEKFNIHVGNKIMYPSNARMLSKDLIKSKALDNKIGGYMISRVAKTLHELRDKLPDNVGVYFANCVQEEIGLRGAEMVVQTIKPKVAIVTDVCHDTNTPGISQKENGDIKLGKGPVIANAPSIHNKVRKLAMDCAKELKVDFQRLSSSSSSGTDTDSIAYALGGVPTALVKVPLRYMHTPTEVGHMSDVDGAVRIMTEMVIRLAGKKSHDFTYLTDEI